MISAQIKKGNIFLIDSLEDYMLQMITLPHNPSFKPLKLNYYNLIENLTQLVNQYSKSKSNISFNLYIIDSYVRRYQKNGQLYRHFFGLTQSWKRYADNHEDAKLFLSVLSNQRNNKQSIRRFIKIRKIVLKTINAKILQQISVTHSDALTICHMLFQGQNRNKVTKKINTLFISLKRKLVNTAKVNGAVACQFFMSAAQELQQQNYPTKQINFPVKVNQNRHQLSKKQNIKNYELSFSQQYASYQKDKLYGNINIPQLEEQWANLETNQKQKMSKKWKNQNGMLNLNIAKQSLNQLFRKDRDIDARLQGTGLIEWKNYPQGWDQFIRNNQKQKQKLLNGVKN